MPIFTRGTDIPGESRVPEILAGNIIPLIFASIFVFARFHARAFITRSWGHDDTSLALAYISCVVNGICACMETQYGSGHHAEDIPAEYLGSYLKFAFITLLAYQLSLSLTKISICFFYLRLFIDRTSRYLTLGTMVFIVLYTIPLELVSLFQCKPVAAIYDVTITSSKCINTLPAFFAGASLNVIVDVWLIGLVVPRIWSLKMAFRQKAALFVVVTLGWLVVTAGIVRVVRISAILTAKDKPWVSYDTSIWSAVEACVGIFCVAAPAIKPLLQRYAPGLMSSLSGGLTYSNENYAKNTRGNNTFIRTGNRNTQNGIALHSYNRDGEAFDKDGQRNPGAARKSGVKFNQNSDTESTENVLGTIHDEKDGITKTTNVSVAVEDRLGSLSSTSERQEEWRHNV